MSGIIKKAWEERALLARQKLSKEEIENCNGFINGIINDVRTEIIEYEKENDVTRKYIIEKAVGEANYNKHQMVYITTSLRIEGIMSAFKLIRTYGEGNDLFVVTGCL